MGIVPVIVNAYYIFVIAIHFIFCHCFDENAAARLNACKGTCQKRFSGFCPLRGVVPPCPLSFFEHTVKGGGYPPIPLRKNSAKKRLFLAKKTLILALFDPFF